MAQTASAINSTNHTHRPTCTGSATTYVIVQTNDSWPLQTRTLGVVDGIVRYISMTVYSKRLVVDRMVRYISMTVYSKRLVVDGIVRYISMTVYSKRLVVDGMVRYISMSVYSKRLV
ncbi:hypothetical protein SARC_15369, partial [Sphaeroforma arctica JP610]